MSQVTDLIKARRSANKFIEGIEIPQSELEDMFSFAKFAPSAFNLQHAHYIAVTDKDLKEKVYEAAYKQYKVHTATAVIVVLGDKKAYKQVDNLNQGMLSLGYLSQREYDETVKSVTSFYESHGEGFQRDEAIRNASLSAMQFMLIAKDKGWDTCPMIGFDPLALKQIFSISDQYEPVLLIALGKEDQSSQRPRGYRKPVGQFVSFDGFKG